uniref:TF-B3 domain-containing protein n=1 Tax=Arundo donax TaxID=35708 RepID=A0A0A9DH92_ARUDO
MNSSGFQKSTKCCFVLPAGYNMSNEQKARVDALVRKIRPQIPLYVTAMDKTTVTGGFLAMAKDFALIHLLDKSGTIKLSQLDCSKTWTISLEVNTNNPCALSTGWMDFIQDNKLQEGDICVFQPSKSKNGVALIFHPLEESRCSQPPGYVPSAKSPRHGLYKPPYYLSRFTALNDQQKNKIDKKVRAIQSDIPPYVAVMQHSNISHNVCILHFGSEYATTCFPRESQSMMLQRRSKDNTW